MSGALAPPSGWTGPPRGGGSSAPSLAANAAGRKGAPSAFSGAGGDDFVGKKGRTPFWGDSIGSSHLKIPQQNSTSQLRSNRVDSVWAQMWMIGTKSVGVVLGGIVCVCVCCTAGLVVGYD